MYDFGTFPETEKRSASLIFTNTGGQTLIISDVKKSCGCTSANIANSKMRYEPGESGKLELLIEPTGPGNDPKYVNIISNSEPDPLARVTLRANILPFLEIKPRMIPDDPTGRPVVLQYGKEHHFTVTVTCPPDDHFTIHSASATDPHVTSVLMPQAPGEKSRSIDVVIAANVPWGPFFSWLEITAMGRPAPDKPPITHTSKIRIQAQLFGLLQADPDTFRFGAKPGERFERKVNLRRPDGAPFAIVSAIVKSSDLPGTIVTVQQIAPNEYELVMTATGDQLRPRCDGVVAVVTDVPGEEQINIPILGVIRNDAPGVQ